MIIENIWKLLGCAENIIKISTVKGHGDISILIRNRPRGIATASIEHLSFVWEPVCEEQRVPDERKNMSQVEQLYNILSDGNPHSNYELIGLVYHNPGPASARLAARVYDMVKTYGIEVKRWVDSQDRKKYWYQIVRPAQEPVIVQRSHEPQQAVLFAPLFRMP